MIAAKLVPSYLATCTDLNATSLPHSFLVGKPVLGDGSDCILNTINETRTLAVTGMQSDASDRPMMSSNIS